MTYPISQASVNCPNCGQAVTVRLEQVIDVGQEPAKKQQFLRGQVNVLACTRCGNRTVMATPLVYHDPAKDLLLAFVPPELNLPMAQEEQAVGRLTNLVLDNTLADKRRGYLLNPTRVMSLNALVERVMESDGVNADQLREQTQKVQLIVKMAEAAYDEPLLASMIEEHRAKIDFNFMTLVTMTLQQAGEMHDEPTVDRYGRLREAIVKQLDLKAEELPSLGVEDNIDALIEELASASGSLASLQAAVAANRPLLDYNFFLHLSQRADHADPAEREGLLQLREQLVSITEEMDRVAQVAIEVATQQLNEVLQAEDVEAKLQELYPDINEAFLVVLSANVEQARAMKRDDVAELLMKIYGRVVTMMEDRLRPEIKAMNQLLRMEDRDERMAKLRHELAIYNPAGFIQMIDAIIGDLEESGQAEGALLERLALIGDEARIVAATMDIAPPVESLFE